MKNKKRIKVFGERNTGTNYLIKLLEINFVSTNLIGTVPKNLSRIFRYLPFNETARDLYFSLTKKTNFGWKHREVNNVSFLEKICAKHNDIVFIAIAKNPYSWLLSLYNRPYHYFNKDEVTFEEFLKTPWKTVKRESKITTYQTPIDIWNYKNKSYLNLQSKVNTHIIKYEELLLDPIKELNNLANELNLEKKSNFPQNFSKSTKDSEKNSNYYKDYYGNEKWKKELNSDSIKIINKHLDKELMDVYKYKIIK